MNYQLSVYWIHSLNCGNQAYVDHCPLLTSSSLDCQSSYGDGQNFILGSLTKIWIIAHSKCLQTQQQKLMFPKSTLNYLPFQKSFQSPNNRMGLTSCTYKHLVSHHQGSELTVNPISIRLPLGTEKLELSINISLQGRQSPIKTGTERFTPYRSYNPKRSDLKYKYLSSPKGVPNLFGLKTIQLPIYSGSSLRHTSTVKPGQVSRLNLEQHNGLEDTLSTKKQIKSFQGPERNNHIGLVDDRLEPSFGSSQGHYPGNYNSGNPRGSQSNYTDDFNYADRKQSNRPTLQIGELYQPPVPAPVTVPSTSGLNRTMWAPHPLKEGNQTIPITPVFKHPLPGGSNSHSRQREEEVPNVKYPFNSQYRESIIDYTGSYHLQHQNINKIPENQPIKNDSSDSANPDPDLKQTSPISSPKSGGMQDPPKYLDQQTQTEKQTAQNNGGLQNQNNSDNQAQTTDIQGQASPIPHVIAQQPQQIVDPPPPSGVERASQNRSPGRIFGGSRQSCLESGFSDSRNRCPHKRKTRGISMTSYQSEVIEMNVPLRVVAIWEEIAR